MTSLISHTVAHSTRPSYRPKINNQPLKKFLLHFVAFFHVASLFVREVENRKVGVDNKKALELTNSSVFHRGRQQKSSRADKWNGFLII